MNLKTLIKKQSLNELETGVFLLANLGELIAKTEQRDTPNHWRREEDILAKFSPKSTEAPQPLLDAYKELVNNVNFVFRSLAGNRQGFFHGYFRIVNQLERSMEYERNKAQQDKTPLLVTPRQLKHYQEEYNRKTAEKLQSVPEIILRMIQAFTADPSKAPEAIKAELNSLMGKKLPKKLAESWGRFSNAGHWSIKTGDNESVELETAEEVEKYFKERQLDPKLWTELWAEKSISSVTLKAFYDYPHGPAWISLWESPEAEAKTPQTFKRLAYEDIEKIINFDFLREDLGKVLEKVKGLNFKSELTPYRNALQWIPSVESWTKGKILPYLPEFYQGRELQAHRDFKKLYSLTADHLAAILPDSLESERMFSIGQLSTMGLANYREQMEPSTLGILKFLQEEDPSRQPYSGIAVVCDPAPEKLDGRGFYLQGTPLPLQEKENILNVANDTATYGRRYMIANTYTRLVFSFLADAYAYNEAIELIKNPFKLNNEQADRLKLDMGLAEDMAKDLNKRIYKFYAAVSGTPKEKAEKRKAIKDLFRIVDLNSQRPDPEKLEELREAIDGAKGTPADILQKNAKDFQSLVVFLEPEE